MGNKLVTLVLFLVSVSLQGNAYITEPKNSLESISQLLNSTIAPDSIDIDCCIDIEYNLEGAPIILGAKLILNDSLSLFKYQTAEEYFKKEYSSITLNKQTADCLRVLLYTLYSNHKYFIKDEYRRKYFSCDSFMWDINIVLGGKKIKEKRNLMHYIAFDEPYHFPFLHILELIVAITDKIERDISPSNNFKPRVANWIKEMFHDKYYLPLSDENANK